MKKFRFIYVLPVIVFMQFCFTAHAQGTDRGYLAKVGDSVPDIALVFDNGSNSMLYDVKAKIVVLQFTASWCSVCRKEMPHLESELWQKYKDKGMMLIGVDLDEPVEKVRSFKKQMKITYPMALDPGGKIFRLFAKEGAGVTRNVVIDMKTKRIIFLTRLYNEKEFNEMISRIRLSLLSDNN